MSYSHCYTKAFDKIWHAVLIYKLFNLDVPSYIIRFIKDFLTDQTLKVKINNSNSKTFPVLCSVPQGSVLGPLLFVVLSTIPLANYAKISYSPLFAKDLWSLFIFKKPGQIKNIIKSYIENLVRWLYKWKLKMNASKCCFAIFSKSGKGLDS